MSNQSDENKSSSGTSESEIRIFREKLSSFQYPLMPKRDETLRIGQNLKIVTNLFEIKFNDDIHKFTLFNVIISPEIAADNRSLMRKIYFNATLPKSFEKTFFSGNTLYAIIVEKEKEDCNNIEITEELNNVKYTIKLEKIKDITFSKINDFDRKNQYIKSIIENLFRNILMSNPKIITFHDRTIFEIDKDNILNVNNNEGHIYKGYITSAHITESGLYLLVNNRSKFISGKTALQKISELRKKYEFQKYSPKEIFEKANEYFLNHKTVLTTYGSLRGYKIKEIDFDKTPSNTNITIKDSEGKMKTISIINYYKNQYGIVIKHLEQPLLIAESNAPKNKKSSSNLKNTPSEDEYVIYLLPELVYITGIEDDDNTNNKRNKNRNIISQTKMNPAKKIAEINNINNLIKSDKQKIIKKNNGKMGN